MLELEKTYLRLWSINDGKVMVVTDLHGDWDAYQRYRDRFVDLNAKGKADGLIFTGDLIHTDSPDDPDHSLEIVLDVIKLQQTYGDAVIYLCGNHELPHIYGFGLSKGDREYTPDFEAALSQGGDRTAVINLLFSLPFFIRTAAGISVTHAGAAPTTEEEMSISSLFNYDHVALLTETDGRLVDADIGSLRRAYAKLSRAKSYDELAKHYLAVSGIEDPRYDHLLRSFVAISDPEYQRLYAILFTKCEREYGEAAYSITLRSFLRELSVGYQPQKLLVAGHMTVSGGRQIVARRHLRLASGNHAIPREEGKYLLFDARHSVAGIADLRDCFYSVWGK
ncbi:MAG: hypothetical protein GY803_11445 [Chloroflexi bacterium]|nr:hypothetical protein [Chloroflexota bacterium]